jgi:nicotinamidase-related amidase
MRTIDRETSSLLVIDFQSRLVPAIHDAAPVIANTRRLLEAARMLEVPTLFTEQNAGGLGSTVAELSPNAAATIAHKMSFDACRADGFMEMLPNRHDVVVAGCEAHVCVLQTVLGLLDAGPARLHRARRARLAARGEQGGGDPAHGAARRRDRHHRDGGVRMARHG